MKLADIKKQIASQFSNVTYSDFSVDFYKELIIALASNPAMIKRDERVVDTNTDFITKKIFVFPDESANMIILQADVIIKQLESAE